MKPGSPGNHTNAPSKESQNVPNFSENIVCQAVFDFADVTVLVVRLTFDENFWIVGLRNGIIKLIPSNGEMSNNIQTLQVNDESSCCVDARSVPCRPEEPSEKSHRIVAVYASGYVRIWYYTGATPESKLLSTLREEFIPREEQDANPNSRRRKRMNQILACSCSLDGERFITGGDDCFIRVYDVNQKKLLRTLGSSLSPDKIDGHVMRVCALQYHPRGAEFPEYKHVFISGGWDDTVQIWDDRFQHSLWVYAGPHISGSDALDIEPHLNQILTSSWRHDSTILQVWRFNDAAVAQLHTSTDDSPPSVDAPYRLDAEQTGAAFRERPIAEVPQQSFEMRSKGYVAKWLGPSFIAFGGSNANVFRVFAQNKSSSTASVTNLPNGVYSVAFAESQLNDLQRPLQLAFCAGPKVYLARVQRK